MDGLSIVKANLMVHVHPSITGDIAKAVHRHVSSLLFTYNDAFQGVILAYTASIDTSCASVAHILPGIAPRIAVAVKSKLLLFSPQPGMHLQGKVAKVGREFVHAVVLGFASVAVAAEDLRGEFRYRVRNGEGLFASRLHRRHRIRVGSVVRFVVKSFDDDMLHIAGSLMDGDTGCVRYLTKYRGEDDGALGHVEEIADGGNSVKQQSNDNDSQFDGQRSQGEPPQSEKLHNSKRRKIAS